MGDPHITTLDSKRYTFNGKGEYILLQVTSIDFMLQARTDQATNSEGNITLATVFVAFVAKEGDNARFQVELDDDKTGMVIKANGQDITTAFYANSTYSFESDELTVERQERNSTEAVSAAFASNIALEVYVGVRNLEFSVTVPTSLKSSTTGLMGNFNDDNTDDFVLPDGTELTSTQVDTERKIFENFGRAWEVTTSTSIFEYPSGESALDYQFPEFEPLFREEASQTLLQEAEQTCGAEKDACIFDLLATGDPDFAAATQTAEEDIAGLTESLNNNLPVLSLTTPLNAQGRWQLTHNQAATLQFSASDEDGDVVSFELADDVDGVTVDNETGLLTYTPDYNNPVVIGVRVSDGTGKSSALFVDVIVCTGCSGSGSCDFSQSRDVEYEDGKFQLSACTCWPAYTGEDCDADVDGCADDPCGEDLDCTDLAASDQGNDTVGYVCGDCAEGYTRDGASCIDINECIGNGTSPVCPENADCTNTVGSFSCSCSAGYRDDPSDNTQCQDIDECAEQTHDCDQLCENHPGNFSCSCFGGNTLGQDGKSCTSGASCSPACSHFCQENGDGSTECGCRVGYELAVDNSTCNDINECAGKSPCAQVCTNTDGSFTCSCYDGFQLSADMVSCTACEASYWGANCASQCQCNGHGTCDRKRGCVCDSGWSGPRCIVDVDECAQDQACPSGQLCTNTIGSFRCSCPAGYTMLNGQCLDVDECADVVLHDCDLSTEDCNNNQGSYSCVCRDGYARDDNNECADIDECAKQLHNCEQVCENTEGSHNCDCYLGYRLDSDRESCVLRSDPCEGVTNLNCSQICTVDLDTNTAHCLCNSGYGLVGTEDCQDINECEYDHLNQCSFKDGCTNTVGSFQCSCPVGSMLDKDGRNCITCGRGTWGQDCMNSCQCDTAGASTCDVKTGCVCNSGFRGTHCEEDIDECASGALTCPELERCVNTRGSAECQCIEGYSVVLGTCTDIDECAIVTNNDCDQRCINFVGGFQCACNAGYERGDNCTDIDECTRGLSECEQGCENTEGSYRCTCPDGLKLALDSLTCVVEDECLVKMDCEDRCAIVNDTETCFCPRGSELNADAVSCDDLDLCASSPCAGSCNETMDGSSFYCSCPVGQFLADDEFSCTACDDFMFGDECVSTCDCERESSSGCDSISGTCACEAGWTGTRCDTDIDECVGNNTCTQANRLHYVCVNLPGSFSCQCDEGYEDSMGTCVDVDECAADFTNECNQNCNNTEGNYTCSCNAGYLLATDGRICVDEDECTTGKHSCEDNCVNSEGSHSCSCRSGRELDSDNTTCFNAFTADSTVTLLNIDATGLNLREQQGNDFKNMVALIQPELVAHFLQFVSGFIRLIINQLRSGSVIVDFTSVINSETTTDPASKLTDALIALATDGIVINGTHNSVQVVVGDLTVTSSTDKCEIMAALNACAQDEICLISDSGSAYCSSSSSSSRRRHSIDSWLVCWDPTGSVADCSHRCSLLVQEEIQGSEKDQRPHRPLQ
ncbi:fibrillin-1 [Plakobranchus ocellatus]|uniref:Fibrillin-1 n=1 Tax=Plakobranchus ocellatus TaxID=259542 RepID=A0AAV3ZBC7_9GAST|nr:fibrillin-1 [Plakobranchus ocellatus]